MIIDKIAKYIMILLFALFIINFFVTRPMDIRKVGVFNINLSEDIFSFKISSGYPNSGVTGYTIDEVNNNEINITVYGAVFPLIHRHRYSMLILDLQMYDVEKIYIKGMFGKRRQIWPEQKRIDPKDITPTPPIPSTR